MERKGNKAQKLSEQRFQSNYLCIIITKVTLLLKRENYY